MGVFITTSKFNKNAIEEAQDKSKNPIILIDGNRLVDILIHKEWDETEDGGKPIVVKTIEIIQVNEEYFENYGKDTPDAGSES